MLCADQIYLILRDLKKLSLQAAKRGTNEEINNLYSLATAISKLITPPDCTDKFTI